MDQRANGQAFRDLHRGPRILVLPNAWDAASARMIEAAGAKAIATSSAGVAFALGYPDGQRIPRDEMLDMVRRIAAQVRVPVTADLEAGYGTRPAEVAETVRRAIDAGAVGMNLEDATEDPASPLFELSLAAERVRAACRAAEDLGVAFTLNARTDVFLGNVGDPGSRPEHALKRLAAYRDAGAGCLFAPGVTDRATIETLVGELKAPLNILGVPGGPGVRELERLGVRRVSVGSAVARASYTHAKRATEELLGPGTFQTLAGGIPFNELNRMMGDVP
jgi:2-methylisocitrate lyase-like PEP mutase family enzyme